jgi:glycosyl transferase family 87
MTSVPHPQPPGPAPRTDVQARFSTEGLLRAGRRLGLCVLAILPAVTLVFSIWGWVSLDVVAFDFQRSFRPAAEAVLNGSSPYPPPMADSMAQRDAFVYLPLGAFVFAPFVVLPPLAANLVVTALMVLLVLVALRILGIRDWRCYGIAILTAPVISAIQTANLTLALLVALAAIWAFRGRAVLPGFVLALTLATKLFLWPVLVWLVATRRYRAAIASVATTAVLVSAGWALIGFGGLRDYPALLRVLAEALEHDSYTIFALASDLGAPDLLARGVGLAVGMATLLGCWTLGRRGDETRSFTLAILASLLLTPIIWLHYFALLLVPIAIVHKRLSPLWAAPLLFWLFVQGFGNGTSFQTAWTLGVVALLSLLVLRAQSTEPTRNQVRAPRVLGRELWSFKG